MKEAAPSIIVQSWSWDNEVTVKNNYTNTINGNHLIFLEGQLFCSTYLSTRKRNKSRFFLRCIMRNLQKNLNIIWQSSISKQISPSCLDPSFLANIFKPRPFPSILNKLSSRPLLTGEGGNYGVDLHYVCFQ